MSSLASTLGQDLLNVPMGDMIREMAIAIADAQLQLDESSIEAAEMMGGLRAVYDEKGQPSFSDSRVFFGRDQISLGDAASLHNATNDQDLKALLDGIFTSDYNSKVTSKTTAGVKTFTPKTAGDEDLQITIPARLSMMELGFTPTFYSFVDTIIEVRIAINISQDRTYESSSSVNRTSKGGSLRWSWRRGLRRSRAVTTTQVNASYASKYNYTAEGSSLLRTKLTPVPPPAILEERIRQNLDLERQAEEAAIQASQATPPASGE